jgi:type III secretion system (T3SS) SseB-like protein
MSDFVPVNFLEMKLVEARAGQMPMPDFLRLFAASMIIVPSMSEVKERWEGFMPMVFDKQGVHMLACFTAPERNDAPRETFGYYLEIMGDKFVTSLRPGLGLVVNPGQPVGFEMGPESLAEFAKGVAARR